MPESITITDNRTGESVEIPIVDKGVDSKAWSSLLPGIWFNDPSFGATAGAESGITELDGGAGIDEISYSSAAPPAGTDRCGCLESSVRHDCQECPHLVMQ